MVLTVPVMVVVPLGHKVATFEMVAAGNGFTFSTQLPEEFVRDGLHSVSLALRVNV